MKKISLAIIVGNVEEYIDRCLESFRPICDELCITRAIGNQAPDNTIDKAIAFASANEIPIKISEYKNKPGNDWPHLDNFAAARNESFEQASGDYCFWCDTDDILEPGSAERIRDLAETGSVAFMFPYNIFGRGISVMRDRMILRGSAKWIFPVHETFQFQTMPTSVIDDKVVITHLPHLTKTGSNERNLTILKGIPDSEMTTGLLYHLHVELALAGKVQASIEVGKRFLNQPDVGRPERYEVFLNLAQATEDPNIKAELLHQAYSSNPQRREALFLLCNNAMNFGMPLDAMAYARQMKATVPPPKWGWTDRRAVYGWVGEDIYCQALRANGKTLEAETLWSDNMLKAGGPRIALVHATRGRPEKAAGCRKVWLDMASQPDRIEHIFAVDADDESSVCLKRFHHVEVLSGGGCVAAWNKGVEFTAAPVVIQLSDDWTPVPKWDDIILERLGDVSEPKVLAISDGSRKDDLLCMAICTRSYIGSEPLFNTRFKSVFSDNWFTHQAYKRKAVIQARDIVFAHAHPVFGTAEMDETYAQTNAPGRYMEGLTIYNELLAADV